MSWEYSCPHCEGMLNPGCAIIMTASNEDKRVLIGMHPQPGKYEVYLPPKVNCEEGTKWDFHCPLCQEDLATEEEPDLCELELHVEDDTLRILFSRVAGEHATFVLHEDALREKHGEDTKKYDPFFETKYYARF